MAEYDGAITDIEPPEAAALRAQWFGMRAGNRKWPARIVERVMNLVYPKRCAITGIPLNADAPVPLSEAGFNTLPWIGAACCRRCGNPSPPGMPALDKCPACRDTATVFRKAACVWTYDDPARALVKALKFSGRLALAAVFGIALAERIRVLELEKDIDIILAAPIRPRTFRHRGFNPSEEIAEICAKDLNKPFLRGALEKLRDTQPQATLPRQDRLTNLAGAFRAARRHALAEKRILIIDDVMTTCATLAECSRACIAAGAKRVTVGVIARATPNRTKIKRHSAGNGKT